MSVAGAGDPPGRIRAPRRRKYDPALLRSALSAQWAALVARAEALSATEGTRPSRLAGWTVNDLVAHVAVGAGAVTRWLNEPAPPRATLEPVAWIGLTATAAGSVDEATRHHAATGIRLPAAVTAAEQALVTAADDRVVAMRFGAMSLPDMLVTRLVEAVVHADDLDPAFPHEPRALSVVVRLLADALAARTPGRAVELRVPPYAAVQCVPGPSHTRGTPRSVVEADPLVWLRVATGRLTWDEAVKSGAVQASGERSDLSEYLPLMG